MKFLITLYTSVFNLFFKKTSQNYLTAGTLFSQIFTYRSKDGRTYFQFSYIWMSSGFYQINIHKQPSYNGRPSSEGIAHWLPTSSNGAHRKICFTTGKEPRTLDIAQKFSMHWAEQN